GEESKEPLGGFMSIVGDDGGQLPREVNLWLRFDALTSSVPMCRPPSRLGIHNALYVSPIHGRGPAPSFFICALYLSLQPFGFLNGEAMRAGGDVLHEGVLPDDVQNLAGHAEPRTTGLYDRRQKQVTRNIVERISI